MVRLSRAEDLSDSGQGRAGAAAHVGGAGGQPDSVDAYHPAGCACGCSRHGPRLRRAQELLITKVRCDKNACTMKKRFRCFF